MMAPHQSHCAVLVTIKHEKIPIDRRLPSTVQGYYANIPAVGWSSHALVQCKSGTTPLTGVATMSDN